MPPINDPPEAPALAAQAEDEISLLEIFNLVLGHRYRIAVAAFALAALAIAFGLLSGRSWVSSASFVPQGADAQDGRLASLAGQFGLNVLGGEGAGQSPAFYAELVRSREILRPVAEQRFELAEGGADSGEDRSAGTLAELLDIEEETPELETSSAIRWLQEEAVRVETDVETGMVRVFVETPWPSLSFAIASQLVTLVNQFNLETRQSRAAAERAFIEGRLGEAEDSLLAAETRLETFLQSNRQFENSPELLFQHDRLQRRVARNQQVVTSLAQAFEEARVSEVRNTPVITVVESPQRPLEPESRGLVLKGLLGLILGGMIGLFWAFGSEMMRREQHRDSETYREFRSLWADTWRDIRGLGRRRS